MIDAMRQDVGGEATDYRVLTRPVPVAPAPDTIKSLTDDEIATIVDNVVGKTFGPESYLPPGNHDNVFPVISLPSLLRPILPPPALRRRHSGMERREVAALVENRPGLSSSENISGGDVRRMLDERTLIASARMAAVEMYVRQEVCPISWSSENKRYVMREIRAGRKTASIVETGHVNPLDVERVRLVMKAVNTEQAEKLAIKAAKKADKMARRVQRGDPERPLVAALLALALTLQVGGYAYWQAPRTKLYETAQNFPRAARQLSTCFQQVQWSKPIRSVAR